MKNLRLASRLFNTPLMVERNYLATFVAAFTNHDAEATLDSITLPDGTVLTSEQALRDAPMRSQKTEFRVEDGVAIIPVSGALVNKGSQIPSSSGMQGYNGILTMFSAALDDNSVESILFDMDSPGGEVSGLFDLCRLIKSSRDEKPIAAFIGEQATSAAYALASATGAIYTPETAEVGSIGVLVAHYDLSKQLEEKGVNVTLIHAGEHKVDGNPFEALSKEVQADIQLRVDSLREKFAALVAENRGLAVEDVLATEAKTFEGAEAVQLGLADEIMSFNEVIETMSKKKDQGVAPAESGVSASTDATAPKLEESTAHTQTVVTEATKEESSAQAIVQLCEKADAMHLVGSFIKESASAESVSKSLTQLKELRGILKAAELSDTDAAKIELNFESPAKLAAAVINATAKADQEIHGSHVAPLGAAKQEEKVDFNDGDWNPATS